MNSQVIRKIYVVYSFLSLATTLNAQQELRHIDTKLDSIFGHYNIGEKPGVSIAIIENNKPTILKSYGHANLEYQIKNTSNTLFNATDLAKQFTVFSILMLQDQGKLSINDHIKKYVPQLNGWPFEITLKHLMEQTSGLRDVTELKKWVGYQDGDVITKRDILNIIAKQRSLNFPSGSKFEYNRTGFVLLTEVIAEVSGIQFLEFVKQHIFTPLGMNNSVFVNSHIELIQNRSYSYVATDNGFSKVANNSSFVGGTNLYTSTSDFAKWLRNMSKPKIGKPSFYEYMNTHIKLSNGERPNYTPGIYKDNREGYWTIHLEGFDYGYTAYMMHIPAHDFSLVYFSNDLDFPIGAVYQAIYDWFHRDYNISPVKALAAQPVTFVDKSLSESLKYTGNYLFEDNFSSRRIVLENDTLFYSRSETNRNPMLPIKGEHTFKMLFAGNENIRVTFKNQGEVIEFRVINLDGGNDYVTVGRKLKFRNNKQTTFSGEFRNEELSHTIYFQNKTGDILLTMGNTTTVLDQVGDNEFLSQSNSKVKYVKVQRDKQQDIMGVYVSGAQIKDLYYNRLDE